MSVFFSQTPFSLHYKWVSFGKILLKAKALGQNRLLPATPSSPTSPPSSPSPKRSCWKCSTTRWPPRCQGYQRGSLVLVGRPTETTPTASNEKKSLGNICRNISLNGSPWPSTTQRKTSLKSIKTGLSKAPVLHWRLLHGQRVPHLGGVRPVWDEVFVWQHKW